MELSEITLDIDRMSFDENGAHGFAWPIAQSEIRSVRDAIFAGLVSTARGNETAGEATAILLSEIASVTLLLYQEAALVRRCEPLGLRPSSSRLNLNTAGGNRAAMPSLPTVEMLRRGSAPKRNAPRRLVGRLREAKGTWRLNSHRKSLAFLGSGAQMAVTIDDSLPLVRAHALEHEGLVRYVHPRQWFPPQETANASPQFTPTSSCIDDLMGAISASFAAGGEELGPTTEAYLASGIADLLGLVSQRLNDLLRKPRALPEALWTGTGAGVWSRLLRHAVRSSGGTVTGHDHGAGVSHIKSAYASLFELESSDTFVTFTQGGADSLRNQQDDELILNTKPVNIISIGTPNCSSPQNTGARTKMTPPVSQSRIIKRVMYPSSFYRGGFSSHYLGIMPDIVGLDWEARLFAKLKDWGFEVLHKPHPSSVSFPTGLAEAFGGTTFTGPFEQAMDATDAYVLTSLQSSTTLEILASGKPVVYIDQAMDGLMAEAREMLGRRCVIIEGRYDGQNRLQVNWPQLHDAIEQSCELADMQFVEHYWGFS